MKEAIQLIFYPDQEEAFREYLDHSQIDKNKSYNCILVDRDLPFKDKLLLINQLLVSMFQALSNNIPEYQGKVNNQGIDIQLVLIMKELGNIQG